MALTLEKKEFAFGARVIVQVPENEKTWFSWASTRAASKTRIAHVQSCEYSTEHPGRNYIRIKFEGSEDTKGCYNHWLIPILTR